MAGTTRTKSSTTAAKATQGNPDAPENAPDPAPVTEATLRSGAVSKALTRLRHEHPKDFARLATEECLKAGVTYKPRLTAEEKAEKELNELIAANPGLESTLRKRFNQGPEISAAGTFQHEDPMGEFKPGNN